MQNKIGILTFQRTGNYGAQFQNYALQEYIKKFNNNIEVIDYQNAKVNSVEKPSSIFKQRNIKDIIKYFKCNKYHVAKWNKFEDFRSKYISYSKICDKKNIREICEQYDGIIVGSDQIWNIDITGEDFTYYLDFELNNEKKYSYAASFGFSELPIKYKDTIISLISNFKYISALQMISTIEKEKEAVLDPTFLLSKDEWITKMELKKENKKDYIFVYMIDENEKNLDKIYKLAQREDLEIIHIRDGFRDIKNINSKRDASPQEFLNLLYNAKYTVIGSFHGLCLSLIFEKNFYYILNNKYNRNSRLIDLVDIVDLKNRNDFSQKSNINYEKVNSILETKINKSKEILNSMVDEINEK